MRGSEHPEANAIRAGSAAFDADVDRAACPHRGPLARYWHLGWRLRKRARERWNKQADDVERTIARAAPFLDQDAPPGRMKPSTMIALGFYSQGSIDPDAAYQWFRQTMRIKRDLYREAHATKEVVTP